MLGTTDPFTTFVGTLSFWIGAVASIAAAYMMVASIKNLIRAALALTTVLGAVAMMYALLGADFLAVAQLAVYVGAIMVLIIFAIFMTPGQIDVPAWSAAASASARCSSRSAVGAISIWVVIYTPWNMRDTLLDLPDRRIHRRPDADALRAAVRDRLAAADGGADRRHRDRPRRLMDFLIPGLRHFLVLGSILFALGMYGVLSRRNAIGILLSIELMLNGVNLLMVAFARYLSTQQELAGQMFAIFIITQAAAEAAVGLAIIIAIYRQRRTIQVDQLDLMKG